MRAVPEGSGKLESTWEMCVFVFFLIFMAVAHSGEYKLKYMNE